MAYRYSHMVLYNFEFYKIVTMQKKIYMFYQVTIHMY